MDEIKGISCEVKNCKYHDGSDCCTAGQFSSSALVINAEAFALVGLDS